MKKRMKRVPITVQHPKNRNMYPMSITFTRRGILMLTTKLKNQLRKVPMLTALSYMISAM